MNSHYNIALLADYEQGVNAEMHTNSKSSPETSGTNTDQTTPKELSTSQDQTAPSFTEDTANNHKPGVTGCVLPLQCQHPGPVHGIPVGYESDDAFVINVKMLASILGHNDEAIKKNLKTYSPKRILKPF